MKNVFIILTATFLSLAYSGEKTSSKQEREPFFITVENRRIQHPSMTAKQPDSIQLYSVYDYESRKEISLDTLVHRETFRQINSNGDYFADSLHVYIYPSILRYKALYLRPLKEVTFAGSERDYMYYKNDVYYRGIRVDSLHRDRVSFFYVLDEKGDTLYEFITDGSIILTGDLVIDKERMQFFEFPQKYRDSISSRFKLD